MTSGSSILAQLNDRSREVFRRVVEGYLASGDPIGSRTLTRSMTERVSAATIRNVMQDLEFLGLLDSPHVSAGRVPTQLGLRMFVDGLMEVGSVAPADRERIEAQLTEDADVNTVLDRVGAALSRITQGASLVLTPKHEAPIRHIEFVGLGPERALVVLVFSDGQVENRVFTPPPGQTPSSMREAANFLNALAEGRTLSELRREMRSEIQSRRQELDQLSRDLVESGVALWESGGDSHERLIVRGQANLLDEAGDLDRIRTLFEDLERKRDIAEFLKLTEDGEGVRIFIGSENKLFSLSGSSLVVSPYMNADRKIIGAIGVIGPTRLNYGRIVPIVDYTAQIVGRIVSERGKGVEMDEDRIDDLAGAAEGGPSVDEIEALRAERDEFRDRFMRALADAENSRKRGERDRREAEQYGGSKFARDMLPVYDALKRAVDTVGEDQRAAAGALVDGVELTLRELTNIFAKHGIKVIAPAVGEPFDPQLHQAMFEAPVPNVPGGGIIQVLSEGFQLHERLLRPAQVGVSSSPVAKPN